MWQAEADLELILSALPVTAVGQLTLTLANWRYGTVLISQEVVNFDIFWFCNCYISNCQLIGSLLALQSESGFEAQLSEYLLRFL